MNKLYLNNDYCYSLEDLRAIIKRCATIGPELDNPLIIELLCALKDGHLKEFLETGNSEEQLLAEKLPDYRLYNSDDNLYNAICRCFDDSYEMGKISIFDYIELVSVHGKIGDGETKEFLPNQVIGVQEGITPIELVAKFKVKKHVNLQLDFYMKHEYAADTCQSTEAQDSLFEKTNNIINLKDTDDCFTVPLHIEIINTHKLGSVLSIIVGKDGYDIENVWKINVCCNSVTIPINDELSIKMIYVKGGSFTMGATPAQGSAAEYDEKPTHIVTLSDYMIGETEVTQELWQAVMGSNPSYFSGTNLPVEEVNWNDCQTFITRLNKLTGKTFRLPTEAEWEYAARGGQKSKGYKYAGSNTLSDVAWNADNSGRMTHPVKQKQANELGLYDMSGNVWEWCQDWYGNYSSSDQLNPMGHSCPPPINYFDAETTRANGLSRVARGGSWYSRSSNCRVAARCSINPWYRFHYLGLRLVLDNGRSCLNHEEIERDNKEYTYLKIIDFGAKTAQVKYIISKRINIDLYKASSLHSNDIIEIHQNDVISLKNELESLGATVQIVDKKSNEAKGALSTVVSGVHKHTADILRQAMENAIKVINETKKER